MQTSRYIFLDELRGFSLCSMIVYHACWNLVYLYQVPLPWFLTSSAAFWQQTICWVFLLLAGVTMHLTRRPLRHALIIGCAAALVSLTTFAIEPNNGITFGILHCIALCIVCSLPLRPLLDRIPTSLGILCCLLLFFFTRSLPDHAVGLGAWQIALPDTWYHHYWLSIFGLLTPDFLSADYFPLFPHLFLFLAGFFAGRLLSRLPAWAKTPHARPLAFLGRHSLLVYLLHQPLLYGSMELLFSV